MVANPCRDASWYEIVEKIQSVEGERGSHAVVLGLYLVVFVRLGHGGESRFVSWANDTSSSIKINRAGDEVNCSSKT